MFAFKLEAWEEAKVILIFHIVGTAMEIFKTHAGSWVYPEENFFRIGGVPLFSGFMYAAVSSYMTRINRIFDIRLNHYPPLWATFQLASTIYINFFTHHFISTFAGCYLPRPLCSSGTQACITVFFAFAIKCHYCWLSCSHRCSSGLRKISVHGRKPGFTPTSMGFGFRFRLESSVLGIY